MKKLILTVLTVLTCGAAYALPVGNPSEASLFTNGFFWDESCVDPCDPCFGWLDSFSMRVGFYGDYVFNRNLEVHRNDTDEGDIDRTSLYTNAGYIALNFCDWIDVFTSLGATSISMRTPAGVFTASNNIMMDLNFDTSFSWSIGGRATIWDCDNFSIGVEGQYFQTNTTLDNIMLYSTGNTSYFNDNNRVGYQEWQVALGASYRFENCANFAFIPYAAVSWSGGNFYLNDISFNTSSAPSVSYTLRNTQPEALWGYAIGMTATLCDMVGVTVEGRFASEKAVYVNGQMRF